MQKIKNKIKIIGEPIIKNSLMSKLYFKYDLLEEKDDYISLKEQNLVLKKKLKAYKDKYEKN